MSFAAHNTISIMMLPTIASVLWCWKQHWNGNTSNGINKGANVMVPAVPLWNWQQMLLSNTEHLMMSTVMSILALRYDTGAGSPAVIL